MVEMISGKHPYSGDIAINYDNDRLVQPFWQEEAE
jgi:hypothetical protein